MTTEEDQPLIPLDIEHYKITQSILSFWAKICGVTKDNFQDIFTGMNLEDGIFTIYD
jgi:hypothetical protein